MKLLHPLFAVAPVLLLMTFSTPALAEQKSMTYTVKMGPVMSRTVSNPGDQPGHSIVRTVRRDITSSSDGDWDATPVVNYGATDVTGGKGGSPALRSGRTRTATRPSTCTRAG